MTDEIIPRTAEPKKPDFTRHLASSPRNIKVCAYTRSTKLCLQRN